MLLGAALLVLRKKVSESVITPQNKRKKGIADFGARLFVNRIGTFTTQSLGSNSSPNAASSRPRLVAKSGGGLTGSLSRANASGAQSAPRVVWNKNQGTPAYIFQNTFCAMYSCHSPFNLTAPTQAQQTPSSLPASAARNLTDEELQERYGIHMTSRLPSQHPPSSSPSHTDSGADGSKPAEHHSQWADEEDDEDDWTPETITWTDGTKHKITPLGEAKTIVKLTPTQGEDGDMKEEKVVLGASTSVTTEKEKEKTVEKEVVRETEKISAAVTASPPVTTVKPIIKSKLSSNTTVLKVGQSAAERAGQVSGLGGAGKGADANANNKSASSLPAKSPWAPLPPVEKVSPIAIAAQVAQAKDHHHPSSYPPPHFDHDRDRFGSHGHGGYYGDRDRDRDWGGLHGDSRHGPPPHMNFRERDFPHAFSNLRDPALQPYTSPPLPAHGAPYHQQHHEHMHHDHLPPPHHHHQQHHGPPPREIAADDFNRTWRGDSNPAHNAPRELYNSRSGRYEPVDPALGGPPHHNRRERGDVRDRRPTQLLQRNLADEKPPAGGVDVERGRAVSNVSAGSKVLTPELRAVVEGDRTRSISPNVAAGSVAGAQADVAGATTGEVAAAAAASAAGIDESLLLPGEDPVAMQQRIMKEKIAEARRRRQEDEAREEAAKQERIRQKLAAMGPPPVKKSKDKEKEKEHEKEKEEKVWKRKEQVHVAGAEKTPEQGKAVPAAATATAASVDAAVKAGLQSPPKPPVVEPSGAPKQYGLMKVHAPEPLRRSSHGREDAPERSDLVQRQQAEQKVQRQQTVPAATTSTPAVAPAGPISSPLSGQAAQVPSIAPSTTTVSPFSPWAAPSPKLPAPGGGPSAVWGSPNAERALGNGTFDRNFAGFRREAPPAPATTAPGTNAAGAAVANNPATPLGVPTSMALDGLTSSPLSPETRNVEHLQPIGRPAGQSRSIRSPQGYTGGKQQHRGHRGEQDVRNRPSQIAAWHNLHNVVAETEADENEKFQREMVALREEEARNGSVPVKFNQTWRKVEVSDEVGSRHVVGVTKTEHHRGKPIAQQEKQEEEIQTTLPSATSPGAVPAGLSPLHGLGNVVGLSPFAENSARPLGSNTTRESRFFPHGGNANAQEKRGGSLPSQLSSPLVPIVPLHLPVPMSITSSAAPAEPILRSMGEFDRSPSPPPPVDFAFSHPVFATDLSRPLVHLPSPRPVVRLPPSQPSATSPPPRHGDARNLHSQRAHGSPAGSHAVTSPSAIQHGNGNEVHPSTWWQEKIDGLLGKKSAPTSPAIQASVGGKHALVVSPSTKEPYDALTAPGAAAVSLPYGAEGVTVENSVPVTLQVTSKDVEEEEEIFEDREAGSLPVVRVPDMAPPKAWAPATSPSQAEARLKTVKPAEPLSRPVFSVVNLGREGGNPPIIVKLAFMNEGKTVYLHRSGGYTSSRGRGGLRGRRGGKSRDSGASYERRNHPRHGTSSSGASGSISGSGSTSAPAGAAHSSSATSVNHAQQPPTAPKASTSGTAPSAASKSATPKPASPPSTQPMAWASRVARGV